MKKQFLFICFMFIGAAFVNAQNIQKDTLAVKHRPMPPMHFQQQNHQQQGFGNRMAMNRVKQMHKRMPFINYTKEQKAQLKTINENYQKQLLQLQSNNAVTLGEYKSKLAELKKDKKLQMQNILTDKQKQMLADAKKKAEIDRKVMATARLERMKLTLGLKDDQVAKIKEQQKSLQTQMKAIRENDMLLPEQKKSQLKQLALQHKNDLKSVLTDEQQKMLNNKKGDFKNKMYERRPDFMGR